MLKSIQSNNSPGHSHNGQTPMVDLSTDSCPGIILKRNNKMKHTKGEWVFIEIEETGEFAIFSLNTFIAQTENPMINEEPTKSEKQANANLIASAPELLNALKKCVNFYFEGISDFQDEVYALIEKAEGKS